MSVDEAEGAIPPTIMIDWNDEKAMWLWVIVSKPPGAEPVHVKRQNYDHKF